MKTINIQEKIVKETEVILQPCPFCGSEDLTFEVYQGSYGYSDSSVNIYCKSCGAKGGTIKAECIGVKEQLMAANKWNRRYVNQYSNDNIDDSVKNSLLEISKRVNEGVGGNNAK